LLFLNSCEGLEEIYNELEKFTGTDDDAHDDIVSALSLLVDQFIGYADMDAKINAMSIDYVADQADKARHDLIYGLGRYSKYNASSGMTVDDNPVTAFQQEQAGISSATVFQSTDVDPLQDVFI
jgi:hypothetical protein